MLVSLQIFVFASSRVSSILTFGHHFLMRCTPAVYAAISSLSLSLLATGIDSIFDIGSNVLLFWLHKKASRMDVNKWPVGGARLETIGNIVYGAFICHVVNEFTPE